MEYAVVIIDRAGNAEVAMSLFFSDSTDARAWLNEVRARILGAQPRVASDRRGGWWINVGPGIYWLTPWSRSTTRPTGRLLNEASGAWNGSMTRSQSPPDVPALGSFPAVPPMAGLRGGAPEVRAPLT
jgi:hypothetical protein